MGLFDKIVMVSKEVQDGISAANPTVGAVDKALSVLPNGELKNWLRANPIQFWNKIVTLIKGRHFQTGQYVLGERYLDQIDPNSPNVGRKDVPDDVVKKAQYLFTILFGVRINNDEDLWALGDGADAYYRRPNKQDIPRNAVDRAVALAQSPQYNRSTYNSGVKWNLDGFENMPLVAPIPAVGVHDTREEESVGKFYNGELPGGATAVEGVIQGDGPLKQLLKDMGYKPPVPGGGPNVPGPGGSGGTTLMSAMPLLLGAGLLLAVFHKPKRRRSG